MMGGGSRAVLDRLRGGGRAARARLRLRAVDRRPRRRRLQGRRGPVSGRARGLRRLQGRRRLSRSRQRQRRHPRRRRPLPEHPRGPRRRRGRGRLPRGSRRRPRRRRHPRFAATSAPTIPRTATASRTRTAARIRTTTRTASSTRTTRARTIPRTRTASRTRTAARIRTTTRTGSPTSATSARTTRDLQRLRGQGRLPRQGPRHHRGQQHRDPREDHVRDQQREDPAGVRADPRRGGRDAEGPPRVPGGRGRRPRRRARHRRLQPAPDQGPRRSRWSTRWSQRGVARGRLVSQGYGEYCPLDQGHNAAAWDKNRRVEFKVVKTEDGDTGVDRGCETGEVEGRDTAESAIRRERHSWSYNSPVLANRSGQVIGGRYKLRRSDRQRRSGRGLSRARSRRRSGPRDQGAGRSRAPRTRLPRAHVPRSARAGVARRHCRGARARPALERRWCAVSGDGASGGWTSRTTCGASKERASGSAPSELLS